MPKIILLNDIQGDGTGDFSHLADIYKALRNNPKMRDYSFIPVILCANNQYKKIEARLKRLEIPIYFLGERVAPLHQNESLQQHLADAEQVIKISSNNFMIDEYKKYCRPTVVYKFIGEHEQPAFGPGSENILSRSLGLSEGFCGIKLTNNERLEVSAALVSMSKSDPAFVGSVLQHSKERDAESFAQHNDLIPAYFNKWDDFSKFLMLVSINQKLPNERNISLYLSGDLGNLVGIITAIQGTENFSELKKTSQNDIWNSEFSCNFRYKANVKRIKDSNIKQIEIIEPGSSAPLVFPVNAKGTRTISIYYGFEVTNAAYNAIYQQAPYAGISGDNTFEIAISNKVFPIYHSTNNMMKRASLYALHKIISQLELPEKVKENYLLYFSESDNFFTRNNESLVEKFKLLDFPAMIQYWPAVADHLIKNHNFYDRLENIFFEKPEAALKAGNQDSRKSQSSGSGVFKEKKSTEKEVKNIQVSTPSKKGGGSWSIM